MKDLYTITLPKGKMVPIIISVPHAGIKFPKEIKNRYDKRMRQHLDDTDWFVDEVYKFAPKLGITMIKANYSRWVIDLNRDPKSLPLYKDGRVITGLTPSTDFLGNPIYRKKKFIPEEIEIQRRLNTYYWPYYTKITELLEDRKKEFGKAVLWDAHSIRSYVPSIRQEKFPDLILGNNDHKTAHPQLTTSAIEGLQSGTSKVYVNSPFKGGHITRYFGAPENNIHALQLEMNKALYMDDRELTFNKKRANQLRTVLKTTLERLIETIPQL